MMRLDKFLCEMGVGTRSEVKNCLKKGQVTLNGEVVKKPETKIDENQDIVCFLGQAFAYEAVQYFLLNKPAGCVTATRDHLSETVMSFLPKNRRDDLFPVGRLDKDTEGLLLITNDGQLAHALLSPKKHVDKTYFAVIDGEVKEEHKQMFLDGLDIGDENLTMPAQLKILKSGKISEIELTIHEGRFHQVKRMFEAVGTRVTYLKRISMGALTLGDQKPGEVRRLTEEEIMRMKTNKIKHIQAVIFDIDGTLVDSMSVWHDIDMEYFKLLEIPMPPTLQKDIEGMGFTEVAVYFKETFQLTEKTIDDIKLDWIRMAYEKYLYEIKAKPGAKEFMSFLKEKGIKIGCATSNERSLAMAALQPHGFKEKVDSVRTACEVNAGKPAPDIYLKVAEDLGVEPKNCLVFEDIPNGMRAGKAAGMTVIGIEDEHSKKYKEEIDTICDYYIRDYYDMLEGKIEVEYELSSGK